MIKSTIQYQQFLTILTIAISAFNLTSCDKGETGPDFSKQFQADIAAIDNYLAANNINAYVDKRGIRFTIEEMGEGDLPPQFNNVARISFTGRLLSNGSVFDSNTNFQRPLLNYIEGLKLALSIMPVGTRATIYIPSGLAYGNVATGTIPANANLIYEIELLEVIKSSQEVLQLQDDINEIDDYLTDNSIDATEDVSGLRYVIVEEGAGATPTWYDKVKLIVTGKVLGNATSFFSGTIEPSSDFDSRVVDFIHGFKAGLQKMPIGSKAVFYIPSGLGFGTEAVGNGAVPANSNLFYEVELVEIVQ